MLHPVVGGCTPSSSIALAVVRGAAASRSGAPVPVRGVVLAGVGLVLECPREREAVEVGCDAPVVRFSSSPLVVVEVTPAEEKPVGRLGEVDR